MPKMTEVFLTEETSVVIRVDLDADTCGKPLQDLISNMRDPKTKIEITPFGPGGGNPSVNIRPGSDADRKIVEVWMNDVKKHAGVSSIKKDKN